MPLLDHFRPPLSQRRHWDSFHGGWAEAMAVHLNQDLLPEHYVAEARVTVGNRVEIDMATFDETPLSGKAGGVALWAPPKPSATAPLDFSGLDAFEVLVINDEEGPRVVAAIELVSPANKDRPSTRKMFAVTCANYLQQGIAVMVVDVVTERGGNLHAELLRLLNLDAKTAGKAARDLYATAYRTVPGQENLDLEIWAKKLAVGRSLPTLPLWIQTDHSIPVDLEQTYQSACINRRITVF